jgi:hypothetical protein
MLRTGPALVPMPSRAADVPTTGPCRNQREDGNGDECRKVPKRRRAHPWQPKTQRGSIEEIQGGDVVPEQEACMP